MTPTTNQAFDVVKHIRLGQSWRGDDFTNTESKSQNGTIATTACWAQAWSCLTWFCRPLTSVVSSICLISVHHRLVPSPPPHLLPPRQEDSERYSHPSRVQTVCIPPSLPSHVFPLLSSNSLTSENWKEPNLAAANAPRAQLRLCAQVMTNSCCSSSAAWTTTVKYVCQGCQCRPGHVGIKGSSWGSWTGFATLQMFGHSSKRLLRFWRSWSRSEEAFWKRNVFKVVKPIPVASTSSTRWRWTFALHVDVADLQHVTNSSVPLFRLPPTHIHVL